MSSTRCVSQICGTCFGAGHLDVPRAVGGRVDGVLVMTTAVVQERCRPCGGVGRVEYEAVSFDESDSPVEPAD